MKTDPAPFSRLAHAKLNLRLEVGKRAGVLHPVVSAIAALEVADVLRFDPSEFFAVTCPGCDIPEQENLVWRAAHELTDSPPPVRIAITKHIPLQAGLGGGSADAAAAILGIARILDEGGRSISPTAIREAATRVGSDVPSALVPGLKIVAGIGDAVMPCACEAPPWGVLLLKPPSGSATGRAYELLDEADATRELGESAFDRARALCGAVKTRNFEQLLTLLHNDFSAVIERSLPAVVSARQRLEGAGAAGTILCGSGSCVAAFFQGRDDAQAALAKLALDPGEWAAVTGFASD